MIPAHEAYTSLRDLEQHCRENRDTGFTVSAFEAAQLVGLFKDLADAMAGMDPPAIVEVPVIPARREPDPKVVLFPGVRRIRVVEGPRP